MRVFSRIKEGWTSLVELVTFGNAEYRTMQQAKQQIGAELARVEHLKRELSLAHEKKVPEMLAAVQSEIERMATYHRQSVDAAAIEALRKQLAAIPIMSPEDVKKMLEQMQSQMSTNSGSPNGSGSAAAAAAEAAASSSSVAAKKD